jgi:transposase
VEREFLEKCLEEGLSLEEIGRRVGRSPSTVSYHLSKHGLEASGSGRYGPNGKVDPARLEALLESGASIHIAASELGVAYSTVRYWVGRLGLETQRMRQRRQAALDGDKATVMRDCPLHGLTKFHARPDGGRRCSACRSEAVTKWRRSVKERLVARAGGCCSVCGYDRYLGALQFHHLDPSSKRFSLSRAGVTRSFAEAAHEADGCALLCANCHAEIEGGVLELPVGKVGQVELTGD